MAAIINEMTTYYARRASEYERIYGKPERQSDLDKLRKMVPGSFAGHDVLEVACGTGYWTQHIARAARRITAVDYNPEVLEIARQKDFAGCRVLFHHDDAYSLTGINENHSAGFFAFWWSHVPKDCLGSFLSVLHSKLEPGAVVVAMDNRYVENSSTPISRKDKKGNTYQLRTLSDGGTYQVLKNFPDESQIRKTLSGLAVDIDYTQLPYYWFLKYTVNPES
ncbi:MAG: methyltransferase domain-containing protein [bacterium]|nr:methyltransferase domain-containing protein [bacterium]